jgi:hypothetical protein
VHYRRSLILPLVLALAACATPAPPPPAEPPPPALLPVIDFPPPPQKIVMVDPFQGAAADLEPLPPATGDLWDRIVLGYKIPDARLTEIAVGLNALSTIGNSAISSGMPRPSTSLTM